MNIKKLKLALATAESKLEAILKPHNEKVAALEALYKTASAPVKAEIAKLSDLLRAREAKLKNRVESRLVSRLMNRAPKTFAEFERFAGLANRVASGLELRHGGDEVKAPKLEGFTVMVMKESFGREKFYGAWRSSGKFVGAMKMTPSRHPGDSTSAVASIKGKNIFSGDDDYWSVRRPVERFLEAVKNS